MRSDNDVPARALANPLPKLGGHRVGRDGEGGLDEGELLQAERESGEQREVCVRKFSAARLLEGKRASLLLRAAPVQERGESHGRRCGGSWHRWRKRLIGRQVSLVLVAGLVLFALVRKYLALCPQAELDYLARGVRHLMASGLMGCRTTRMVSQHLMTTRTSETQPSEQSTRRALLITLLLLRWSRRISFQGRARAAALPR